MTVPSPNNVSVTGQPNIVHVDHQLTTVTVEELRNVVTVTEEFPNEVFVSITGDLTRVEKTSLLYGSGAPWDL